MTITFQHEWTGENGGLRAIPHITTKNSSFLRTAQLLKRMGIANYAFALSLYDPDLKDVDVYNLEENTPDNEILRTKVMIEARRNGWYYLRECVRIYEQGGSPVPFRLDRGSCAMAWCFFNGLDYCGMQPRQTGKASRTDSLILTTEGWRRMGDIKIGDFVVTPDGGTAPVIGVYPQGMKDIHRVYFEDGRWTDCCEEHLWKVYHSHWEPADDRWRVVELRDIIEHRRLHPTSESGFSVPLLVPQEKPDIDLPIDPYVLGAILGDGHINEKFVQFASADQFIVDEINQLLPDDYELVHCSRVQYSIRRKSSGKWGEKSPFLEHLRQLKLNNTRSHTKFIPDIYLNSSVSQKLALLQGLFDTDGTVDKSSSVSFCTTSEVMALQIQALVRSLGGICKIKTKQSFYTLAGERREGKLAYNLRVRIDNPKSLFRLPRKKDRLSDAYKFANKLKLRISEIESAGCHEAVCIEIAHPEHLYITDDYIVTHNTVCALSLTSWVLYSSGLEFEIGMMAKDNSLRQDNVKRVKSFGENLPGWWLVENRDKDKKNAEEILYSALKTHYKTFVAQKEKSQADKQARGASPPMFHFDEFEFTSNIGTSYPTILASTGTARENARKNGKPHSNIITTTAGDPLKEECRQAMALLDGAMPFTERLYDLDNREHLHEVVEASSQQKMVMGVFSHLQLGYDNKWLRDKIARNRMTRDQVLRDYLNRRVSIQDDPVIPASTLALITASEREPTHIQIMANKFVIYWYLPKDVVSSEEFKQRSIVVGCDSSEMIGRDSTTLIGIDPRTLETVFSFRCSEGNINVIGAMIAHLMLMFPKMILVPENKSSGTAFIDNVSLILRKQGHNPFTRMFNWVVDRRNEAEFAKIDIRDTSLLDTNVKKFFGIKTDKTKREELYGSTLLEAANRASSRVRDRNLIQELSSLTVRNGRVDHAAGGHDDTVIAWLMAMWFILNGKHHDVYGIKPGTVLSYVNPGKPDQNKLTQERQTMIRNKIDDLEKAIRQQPDPSLRKLLEGDVTVMRSLIDHGPLVIPTTADELTRDPQRYTDPITAEQSRTPVHADDMGRSLRLVLGLG